MKVLKKCLFIMLLCLWQGHAMAAQWQFSFADDDNANPDDTYGGMVTYTIEPEAWQTSYERTWLPGWEVGVNLSAAYWRTRSNATQANSKKSLYTAAVAPQFTLLLYDHPEYQPYVAISIGPAYLSTVKFASQHLGGHVNFQDRVGIGMRISKYWDVNLGYLHYSNANVANRNDGVDIHWLLSFGWR